MAGATQTALTVAVPTLAVLIGILVNTSRLSDLREHMDRRMDDLRDLLRAESLRVEQVMDARLKRLEENR